MSLSNVINNEAEHRFEISQDGLVAFSLYQIEGSLMVFTHTEVPEELEGKGVGSSLARAALDYAREHGFKVLPLCPFIRSYIERHPEYQSLVTNLRFKS